MAVRRIRRSTGVGADIRPTSGPGWNSIRVDRTTNLLMYGTGEDGGITESAAASSVESVTSPLTAFAGGGQGSATQLNAGINNVTVVATAADSVKLPLAVVGQSVTVRNNAANAMQVFGSGTDTINSIATATGISQPANSVRVYSAVVAAPGGNWLVDVMTAYSLIEDEGTPQIVRAVINFVGAGVTVTDVGGETQVSIAGGSSVYGGAPSLLAGDGAIDPNTTEFYVITKGSGAVLTLAAPTNPGSDGVMLVVTSNTAFAHVINTATILDTGSAVTTTATFAAFAGASVTLMAYAGRWKVISDNEVTFS